MRSLTGAVKATVLASSLLVGALVVAAPSTLAAGPSGDTAAPTTVAAASTATTTTTTTVSADATTTTAAVTTTTVPAVVVDAGAPTPTTDPALQPPTSPSTPTRGGDGEVLPAGNPAPPTRGDSTQMTPTLPPPTTTTTMPPEMVLPSNSGEGRRVVYSNSLMRVWAVESDGTVVKTHRVSGKRYVPSPGTYSVFSRSLYTYSRSNPSITWMYMVRFAHSASGDNIGFHEIPTQCSNGVCWKLQAEWQLGQPLSGGCVRQSTADAIWMWNWAQLGTKVVVLP